MLSIPCMVRVEITVIYCVRPLVVIVEQMAETIMQLKKQRLTVVLSEQNLHFARLVADRAIIIEGGQKRFDGTFAELDSQPEIQEAYLSV